LAAPISVAQPIAASIDNSLNALQFEAASAVLLITQRVSMVPLLVNQLLSILLLMTQRVSIVLLLVNQRLPIWLLPVLRLSNLLMTMVQQSLSKRLLLMMH